MWLWIGEELCWESHQRRTQINQICLSRFCYKHQTCCPPSTPDINQQEIILSLLLPHRYCFKICRLNNHPQFNSNPCLFKYSTFHLVNKYTDFSPQSHGADLHTRTSSKDKICPWFPLKHTRGTQFKPDLGLHCDSCAINICSTQRFQKPWTFPSKAAASHLLAQ